MRCKVVILANVLTRLFRHFDYLGKLRFTALVLSLTHVTGRKTEKSYISCVLFYYVAR